MIAAAATLAAVDLVCRPSGHAGVQPPTRTLLGAATGASLSCNCKVSSKTKRGLDRVLRGMWGACRRGVVCHSRRAAHVEGSNRLVTHLARQGLQAVIGFHCRFTGCLQQYDSSGGVRSSPAYAVHITTGPFRTRHCVHGCAHRNKINALPPEKYAPFVFSSRFLHAAPQQHLLSFVSPLS